VLLGLTGWSLVSLGLTLTLLLTFLALALLPASELATALVNRAIGWGLGSSSLPGLELAEGVPPELRTLVVVPTLLVDQKTLLEDIERLEVHYLSGAGGDISFALLTDGLDAKEQILDGDAALLGLGREAIAALNARRGRGPAGDRFLLLNRE